MSPSNQSESCSTCRGACPTPQACGSVMPLTVPLAQPERPPTFRPDFGIEGPHPEPIAVAWWVLPLVIFLILIVAGAVARWLGVS